MLTSGMVWVHNLAPDIALQIIASHVFGKQTRVRAHIVNRHNSKLYYETITCYIKKEHYGFWKCSGLF